MIRRSLYCRSPYCRSPFRRSPFRQPQFRRSPALWLAVALALTVAALTVAAPSGRADDPAPVLNAAQKTAVDDVLSRQAEINEVNQKIWQLAELGLEERESAALLVARLKSNGFRVRAGVSNMPTAFVAEYGAGRPIIGVLAEYDALPGMSQAVAPERTPRVEGGNGHACGHSGLGAGALAAALGVKAAIDKHQLQGTIRMYGTPAEETLIGKVYMLLDKQFDDLDFCLHWHPSTRNAAQAGSSKAMVSVKFTFRGVPAHGAVSPHVGRSALDAVELMNVGVNYMREHVKEDSRTHYVITNGGGQPNVVPPEATVWYFIRADTHQDVEYNFQWIKEIAQGAALMTRTRMSLQIDTDCHEVIPNLPLAEAIDRQLRAIGPPKFTEAERLFAARLQAPLQKEFGAAFSQTLNDDVLPPTRETGKGSTDVGDISWHVPTGGLQATCLPHESPGHSWQNVASIGSSIGEKGTLYAGQALAAAAVQLLQDDALRAAARADWEARMKGRKYTTLIPDGQQAPNAIR